MMTSGDHRPNLEVAHAVLPAAFESYVDLEARAWNTAVSGMKSILISKVGSGKRESSKSIKEKL